MEIIINGKHVEIITGDITAQPDMAAIVNAANAQLLSGGGVAGAIHRAAGPGLERECRPLAPIKPGEAVITGAHSLPNQYVIHCLGPVYGVNEPAAGLLASCYRNALNLADKYKIESVAFPAISTGIFGYPRQEAAQVAFHTILDMTALLKYVKKIRMVLYNEDDRIVHEKVLSAILQGISHSKV
ncbi:MAG: macro domain-containing protein [Syntrophomonadaceae bacterium]|jgi:O-acetyl-ADP-ribose deacetylase (regulator of RNase III)